MRFIGNKEKLLQNIYEEVVSRGITSGSFCDFFAGTASVGKFFKSKGFEIVSADLLYSSYVLQRAYIKNNCEPKFLKLLKYLRKSAAEERPLTSVVDYLNKLAGTRGFIYKNYTEEGTKDQQYQRMYFSPINGLRIDGIRITIEKWKEKELLSADEYFVLLACLVESVSYYANVSGVYAAYLKKYDPRALKTFMLREIAVCKSDLNHSVFNVDSMDMVDKLDVDVLYLDPPYNARQYGSNYHLIETIAKYDKPAIRGKAGMRDYSRQKSVFCNEKTALAALKKIVDTATYKYLILSYNSEGIMPSEKILEVLSSHGGECKLVNIDYRRFKSNNNGDARHKKIIQEQLYVLRSEEVPAAIANKKARTQELVRA